MNFDFAAILLAVLEHPASALHITAGAPPTIRVRGRLKPLDDFPRLAPQDTREIIYGILNDDQRARFERDRQLDFAYQIPGAARFRVNAYQQRFAAGAAFRQIPTEIPPMSSLGLPPVVDELVKKPRGLVLVTGPTGSGKSTTLYAALGEINTPEKNIITIEDPVEYQLEGLTQVQTNSKAGLSFANGLRAMMRADPDVIMVGEIRDRETAQIAVEAALTGHLVLSTLHTNDAPTALTRLIEMGIEPFLVASAIDCVVAQRLARTLCQSCKRRTMVRADVLRDHGFASAYDLEAYEPVGCARCGGSGYKGRIGLYEVMTITEEIRTLAIQRGSADEIARVAVANGMKRLREDGLDKVRLGITSIAEVARVTGTG